MLTVENTNYFSQDFFFIEKNANENSLHCYQLKMKLKTENTDQSNKKEHFLLFWFSVRFLFTKKKPNQGNKNDALPMKAHFAQKVLF